MKKGRSWISGATVKFVIAWLLLIVLGGATTAVVLSQSVPEQPIQFPHSTHVGLGLQCRYCHPGVDWGPTAGLPTTNKCWGCHQQVKKPGSTELAKLTKYAENKEQIPWVPVAIQPDFVHFNHRPHVAAGVACETCHGDMGNMTVATQPFVQNMGWCLDCHKRMRPADFVRLSDCSTCHY